MNSFSVLYLVTSDSVENDSKLKPWSLDPKIGLQVEDRLFVTQAIL